MSIAPFASAGAPHAPAPPQVKVEPLRDADAIDATSGAGAAACVALFHRTAGSAVAGSAAPRRPSSTRSFSTARETRLRAASSVAPIAAATS
jgi:hypothetical protein